MRRAFLASIVAVGLGLLSGCTINHDFTFSIDKMFTVKDATKTTFASTQVVDAKASSSDFNKYVKDISSIEILSADYTITANRGTAAGQSVSSTLNVADANGAGGGTFATASSVNLTSSVGVLTPLTIDKAVGTSLGNWLKNDPNKAQLTLNAVTNAAPTDFDVKITLHIKATYSAGIFSLL